MYNDFFSKIKKELKKFFSNRTSVIGVFFLILFVVLLGRLFDLQILKGKEYYASYVNTTKKEVEIPAMRGNIYDKNGILLAGNKVVYNVTMVDENYYQKSNGDYNEMILRLIHLLGKYDCQPISSIPVRINENSEFEYSGSDSSIKRFIRDVYGYSTDDVKKKQEEGNDPYSLSAETVMGYLMKNLYNFNSKWSNAENVSKSDALAVCHIRYAMSATTFTKYISTSIATDVSEQVQAAILESQEELLGVAVEESYQRIYYDSECFSSILGYVGGATQEELDAYNADGGHYVSGDIIGKDGIESAYETSLQGTKGSKTIYVNSTGIILAEENVINPVAGKDVYLSIDANLTIATYNIIQQQLAGVVYNHLYEGTDYDPEFAFQKDNYAIPIRDVYFQMINNNVLNMNDFYSDSASELQKGMYQKMEDRKQEVVDQLILYLSSRDTTPLGTYDEYMQQYIKYFYSFMNTKGYLNASNITSSDPMYQAWKSGDVSLPDVIIYALENGWADVSVIDSEQRYNTVDECYNFLIQILTDSIQNPNNVFEKLVYDELIHQDRILGNDIGIALMEQGVIAYSNQSESTLSNNNLHDAYEFFRNAIGNLEISPAQLAVDPCSAGTVVMDPNNGKVLALVSYPGYDANQINNTEYYNKLINDSSSPLYNRSTQTRIAPGSTFKLVTSTAALEGNYVGLSEYVTCTGTFDKLDHPQCWIARSVEPPREHGPLDIVHAIGQSCNVFFYEMGYRFSTDSNGNYNAPLGISVIQKYASMYGFGSKTGLEITENSSSITDELPVTSAIGQGTNAFTNVSLARYVVALASRGNVYEMKLLDRIQSGETVVESYTPQVVSHLDFKESTWDKLQLGMYTVVHEGGSRNGDFNGLKNQYAGKSGTAQENLLRASHGLYISYGPYENPQYAVATMIPNGYAAGNASTVVKGVYDYLEGGISLEEILEKSANSGNVNNVLD